MRLALSFVDAVCTTATSPVYNPDVSDSDSPTEAADTPTQHDAESGEAAPTVEQTTASERNDKSSESERIRGLQAVAGRKETEKQAALAERDAAIADRDEAASALAALQAEYDVYLQGYVEPEAPAVSQPVADEPEPEPVYTAPILRQNNGQMPVPGRTEPRPRLSEAETALRGMEQVYAEHMRGLTN